MDATVIIGGGAAGLACALTLAQERPDARVLVLERMDRVGKKLLATGNGRCNLSNSGIAPAHYHTCDPRALTRILAPLTPEAILGFFEKRLGLFCVQEEDRFYPYCRQASMVLDVFLPALERAGVELHCGVAVRGLRPAGGGWEVRSADGQTFRAGQVVLAAGGRAQSKLGSDGSGFGLAEALGLPLTPLYPALTAFTSPAPVLPGLKGLRALCGLTLRRGQRVLAAETGEVQFTEKGLSGIPAFQLSCVYGQAGGAAGGGFSLSVDLFPDWPAGRLARLIAERAAGPGAQLETFLLGLAAKRLLYARFRELGLWPLTRAAAPLKNPRAAAQLAEALKDWAFPISGTLGWESAQVTGGGVPLDCVDPATLECKDFPGLYLAGEVLDAAGDCGGFNLHWAWGTGILAAKAIAARH